MKIQSALVSNILDRSQRYFAQVTTVTLSWRVQNIVVISRVYFTLDCFEFSSNSEFDRYMLSGTGAWAAYGAIVIDDVVHLYAFSCIKPTIENKINLAVKVIMKRFISENKNEIFNEFNCDGKLLVKWVPELLDYFATNMPTTSYVRMCLIKLKLQVN